MVFFVFGQVYCFGRVVFQIVKLFIIVIYIAGVFPSLGAEGFGAGDGVVLKRMFVEEFGPPPWLSAFEQREQTSALHLSGDSQAGQLQNCRCDIDVKRHLVEGNATAFGVCSGVKDYKWDADR